MTEGVLTVVDGVEVNVRLVRIRVRVTTGPARATLGKQSIDPIRRVQVEVQCEPAHDYHSHLSTGDGVGVGVKSSPWIALEPHHFILR